MYSPSATQNTFGTIDNTMLQVSSKAEKTTARTETVCTISVVIAWVNSFELLAAGLDALLQGSRQADEIIVVTRHGKNEQNYFRQKYQNVKLIAAPPETAITGLRSIGIKHSVGSVVVVTEDHCVPSEKWLATVERRIAEGFDVVGGAVENAWDERLRDWAAFLTEYAFAIRSRDEKTDDGEHGSIPGNNVAYRRELIDGLCETLDADLWESFYYDDLRREGKRLMHDSEMLLYHRRPFDFFYFIGQRFHFCRSYAEMRSQSLNGFGRVKYGLGSAILPPLLWLRGLQTLLKKQRMVGRYILCSPLMAFYLCAGAFGEMIGYFFGGGTSLGRVE